MYLITQQPMKGEEKTRETNFIIWRLCQMIFFSIRTVPLDIQSPWFGRHDDIHNAHLSLFKFTVQYVMIWWGVGTEVM